MNIIFGTDGWRALLDSEINDDSVSVVAQAFADYLNSNFNNPTCAVGFDGRKNSKNFADLFSKVLSGNNIKVTLSIGITPTPVVSYFVKHNNHSAGVMITASHNPAEYNGIKFKANYGGPFFTEETHKVEKLLYKSEIKQSKHNIVLEDFTLPYKRQIYRMIDFASLDKSDLSVLIDSMGGAGQTFIQDLLLETDIEVDTIYGEADENFSGRNAEPIEKNLNELSDILRNSEYSLGLATDGDADRCGVILDNGDWLSAQETILILSDYIKNIRQIKGSLVKTSSVTNKLNQFFENDECKVYDVQVGFKYICEKMIQEDIAFGGEESGGFGYKGHIPERDGILTSLLLIEMLSKSGHKKLSDYVKEKRKIFGEVFYDRIDHPYHKSDRNELLPNIFSRHLSKIGQFNVESVHEFYSSRNVINGLKYNLVNGCWLLMRSSETEPLVRIYAEGNSTAEVKLILSSGMNLLDK